jgi:hypothetical protein
MRTFLALGALTIATAVAACTSIATSADTGKYAGVQPTGAGTGPSPSVPPTVPAGAGPPSVVTATCTDRTSDRKPAASDQLKLSGSGHRNQGRYLPA